MKDLWKGTIGLMTAAKSWEQPRRARLSAPA
jgi:hypothetical protein